MNEFDPNDIRSMMNYVEDTSTNDSDEVLLKFVENTLFLESQSHSYHLQCDNYAKHMELNELYEEFPEYADAFIEGLMSTRGPIVSTGASYTFQPLESAVEVLESYRLQCIAMHEVLDKEEEFGSVNSLENIMSFIDGILYKLKTLA